MAASVRNILIMADAEDTVERVITIMVNAVHSTIIQFVSVTIDLIRWRNIVISINRENA